MLQVPEICHELYVMAFSVFQLIATIAMNNTLFLQLKISSFLEGKKHWRLYEPADKLPRFSSHNMSQEDLGTPILETDLEPGDLLYLPRGTIHQV